VGRCCRDSRFLDSELFAKWIASESQSLIRSIAVSTRRLELIGLSFRVILMNLSGPLRFVSLFVAFCFFGFVATARGDTETLIPFGATWKYIQPGQGPGSPWRTLNYDDSAWLTGQAQFGYADNDETTPLPCGPANCNDGFWATNFFRHEFNVANIPDDSTLVGRVLRDEAAIVYLNGVQVFRDRHIPPNATATTTATRSIGDNATFAFTIPDGVLTTGRNILAVALHNGDAVDPDASFDFQLRLGDLMIVETTEINRPTIQSGFPASDTFAVLNYDIPAGHHVVGATLDGILGNTTANFGPQLDLYADGALVGQCVTGNFCFNIPYAFQHTFDPVELADFQDGSIRLRAIQREAGAMRFDRMSLVVETAPGPAPAVTHLIPLGAAWKYWDRSTSPGTAWNDPGFNDANWEVGPAHLGYGDGDESSVVDRPTNFATTYFRHEFEIEDVSGMGSVALRLIRDDAAAVYVNGLEVFRDATLPADATGTTYARAVGIENGQATIFLDPNLFIAGRNVIAIEVHQESPTSSDLSFDLRLTSVAVPEPAGVTMAIIAIAVGARASLRRLRITRDRSATPAN
jgi:hypothetical protein